MLAALGTVLSRTLPKFAHPGLQCIGSSIDEARNVGLRPGKMSKGKSFGIVDNVLKAGSGRKGTPVRAAEISLLGLGIFIESR
jgi:hypothetical protein